MKFCVIINFDSNVFIFPANKYYKLFFLLTKNRYQLRKRQYQLTPN